MATTAADLGSAGNLLQHPEMVELYFGGLIQNAGGWVIALVILLAIVYVILDRKDRLLHSVLAIGGLVMLLGFMSMTTAGDPARYLTPISIIALVMAATVTLRKGVAYLPLIAVSAIVLFWVWTNAATVLENPTPDYVKNQQALVNLLESKNITHAYADYWDANVNTYLSGGRVTVEPVYLDNDRLKFQYMNSAPGWTNTWPDGNDTRPVLITTTDSSLDSWARKVSESHPPEAIYEYASGRVYVYNGTLPAWPAEE